MRAALLEGEPVDVQVGRNSATPIVFGEHRSFAPSLILQALTGSLFGFPMASEVTDTWTAGYTFIALDPTYANPEGQVAAANSRLVGQLHAARDTEGGALCLPGERDRATGRVGGDDGIPHVGGPAEVGGHGNAGQPLAGAGVWSWPQVAGVLSGW